MLTIMILCGETSGDLLGAPLLADLKATYPLAKFIGIGGEHMAQEGLKSLEPLTSMNVMGLTEVLPKISYFKALQRRMVATANAEKIDLLITIDAPSFTLGVAQQVKAQRGIPCVHYASPKIWAWRRKRVFKMAKYLDHVLALFPFEPAMYTPAGLPCTFVGHPVTKRLAAFTPTESDAFGKPQNTIGEPPKVALFVGSRRSEMKRHWPLVKELFAHLKQEMPNLQGVLPLPTAESGALLGDLPPGLTITTSEDRFKALQTCDAALAKSGTNNLELAMLGVPPVVYYQVSGLTYAIAKLLVNVPYISPLNWVLGNGAGGKKAFPEAVQHEATAERLATLLLPLLQPTPTRQVSLENLASVRAKLSPKTAPSPANVLAPYIAEAIARKTP